jgi:hypothetical protein
MGGEDTVGEQVSFQELVEERFRAQRFIAALTAPKNLAGAVDDFARNGVIGLSSNGSANLIGDGVADPVGTAAFPKLESKRQIFVVITAEPVSRP